LAWLLARYRETTAWSGLSAVTRRRRDNIFKGVIETAGHSPYARITQDTILAGKARRAATPHQARHFLDAMRGFTLEVPVIILPVLQRTLDWRSQLHCWR
jgi:hypothetical protein